MFVIHRPPAAHQFLVDSTATTRSFPPNDPRFVVTNVMNKADTTLEVPVRGHILVIATRRAVVGEAEPLPISKVHVQQPLIGSIEAYTPLCKSQEGVIVTHVGLQAEYTTVETVWPTDIGHSSKSVREVEQLIRSAQGHYVGVKVYEV